MMQKVRTFWVGLCVLLMAVSCAPDTTITSPDQRIRVAFQMVDNEPQYSVSFKDKMIINNSTLGFVFKNDSSLEDHLQIKSISSSSFDETWEQPWGEERIIRNHYNELQIILQETTAAARLLAITFRVFDDGVAFRYSFPEQANLSDFIIMDELTSFNVSENMKAWWIPAYGDQVDSEFLYQENDLTDIPEKVHTPLTMQSNSEDLYLSIHEAALVNYAGMTLSPQGQNLNCDLVPWSSGEKVFGKAPMSTPWRTIQIAENAGDLIASHLILNLNEPNKLTDLSYIQPGKYNGIWWGMHLEKYSWASGENHGAATDNVKEYIDFASENNLSGVLVEGWNEGWDGDWTLGAFNFTKPYDDFDIVALTEYAARKGVSIIGHHETGGDVLNYENQLPAAYEYYQQNGIHAVKTGYVSRKPSGEYHQGQFMVRHYQKTVEMAAEHQIALDIHEPVKATGLRRTYPNLMTREGARGTEYEAWSEGNPPAHTVILPFTRCLAGPLDYTPGIFDILLPQRPQNRVHTTLAKQLALYVTIYSPWQMAADLPENYNGNPALQFIRDVPTDWEHTEVLNAVIGEFLTIARKDRKTEDWYIGSITNTDERQFEIALDFLSPDKQYKAEIYADSDDADWETNPAGIRIDSDTISSDQTLKIKLASGGGQAIRLTPLK